MDSTYLSQSDADSIELQKLLQTALRCVRQPGVLDLSANESIEILDLACGPCRELKALGQIFRPADPALRRSIHITGADIRAAEIDEARHRAADLKQDGVAADFLVFDCSRLDRLKTLNRQFDFVFLRHQNYWNAPKLWEKIFEQGLSRLKSGGVLAITSYFDREHTLAMSALKRAGANLLLTVRNPHSRPLPTAGKSVDRHLALFGITSENQAEHPNLIISPSTSSCSLFPSAPLL